MDILTFNWIFCQIMRFRNRQIHPIMIPWKCLKYSFFGWRFKIIQIWSFFLFQLFFLTYLTYLCQLLIICFIRCHCRMLFVAIKEKKSYEQHIQKQMSREYVKFWVKQIDKSGLDTLNIFNFPDLQINFIKSQTRRFKI